jgi:hypothetical protein
LANFYAKEGDKARAVRLVAGAQRISLLEASVDGEFGRELAGLAASGNQVAVRRLLKEAVGSKVVEADQLAVALSWYAAAGDWEGAWRAASRLVTAPKKGH